MDVLLLADETLGNALEPALRRAGFSVERAPSVGAAPPAAGRLVVAPLKVIRGAGQLLESAPGTVCVLLPPGREGERAALLAAGAAEVFESPLKASTVATRLSELARARAAVVTPLAAPPEPPKEATASEPVPAAVPSSEEPAAAQGPTSPEPAPAEVPLSAEPPAAPVLPGLEPAPTSAPSAVANETTKPSLASQLFDTTSWPAEVPSLETAREALVVRARGALEVSDRLGEVFRTLSEPELEALRASEPTSDDDLLIRGAAQRLVVRHVADQAATLRREEKLVEIDPTAFTAVRDATTAIAAELEAAVDRAVREDPEAFQRLAPSRAGITRALRELDNAGRLLRGEALLDDAHPLDVAVGDAPTVPRPTPRKSVATLPPDVRLPPPSKRTRSGIFVVLGVVAVAVAFLHVFVLGTFRSQQKDLSPMLPAGVVAGVPLVRHGAVLEARTPPTREIAEKAAEVGQQLREPVVLTTPEGQPIGFAVRGAFAPAPDFQSLAPPAPEPKP